MARAGWVLALIAVVAGLVFSARWARDVRLPIAQVEDGSGRPVDVTQVLAKRRAIFGEVVPPEVGEALALEASGGVSPGPLSASLTKRLCEALMDSDSKDMSGYWADIDGDARCDLALKRYWQGSGAAFELAVLVNVPKGFEVFRFSGNERGACYLGEGRVDASRHLLFLPGQLRAGIMIPSCLVDRGAESLLNWPTIYTYSNTGFVVSDVLFKTFYRTQVVKTATASSSENSDDAIALRNLVYNLGH
jgi:hypothetical protein